MYLTNDQLCDSICPPQFVPDINNTKCVCRPNSTLQNSNCPCNTTYFDLNEDCQNCPQYCDSCSSTTVCLICQTGYLLTVQGTCTSSCPNTFIPDQTNKKCVCPENSSISNLQCTCNIGFIDINGVCQQCPSKCNICQSQTVCSQCESTFYLTVEETCVSQCPKTFIVDQNLSKCVCDANRTQNQLECPCNQYYVDIDGVCQSCPLNCIQCSSQTQCTVCDNSYFLTVDMTCVSACPLTFIVNSTQKACICDVNRTLKNNLCPCNQTFIEINGVCEQFPQNCNIWQSQTICLECQVGYYLTVEGACVQSCPQKFTVDNINNKCVCDKNRILQNNQCLCNSEFVEIKDICQPCPSNCTACSSQTSCTQCQNGYFLTMDLVCVSQCPSTSIVDLKNKKCVCSINQSYYNNECITCQDGCIKCTSSTNCLLFFNCPAQFQYDFQQKKCVQCLWDVLAKKCVKTCTSNQIYDSVQQLCYQCQFYEGNCVSSCPLGFYSEMNFQCQQCDQSCRTCDGYKSNQCRSCNFPLFLQDDLTCSICSQGQFLDPQKNICLSCSFSCLSCYGPNPNNCLSCRQNQVLSKDTSECLTQQQAEDQIQEIQKMNYSDCDESSMNCSKLFSLSESIQKIFLAVFVITITIFFLFVMVSGSNNLLGCSQEIQQ